MATTVPSTSRRVDATEFGPFAGLDEIPTITVIEPLTVCPFSGEINQTTEEAATCGTHTASADTSANAPITYLRGLFCFTVLFLVCLTSHEHGKTIEIASLDVVRSARAHQVTPGAGGPTPAPGHVWKLFRFVRILFRDYLDCRARPDRAVARPRRISLFHSTALLCYKRPRRRMPSTRLPSSLLLPRLRGPEVGAIFVVHFPHRRHAGKFQTHAPSSPISTARPARTLNKKNACMMQQIPASYKRRCVSIHRPAR